MNLSFSAKIRWIIILILAISILQNIIILKLIPDDFNHKIDLQNTIYITSFIQIVFGIIIFSYIPLFLQKAFMEIHQILKDLSQGIYNLDLDLEEYKKTADKEFYAVIEVLVETVKSIEKFDLLKKEKIVEHHNRIQAILNLAEDGFLILDSKGAIVYINDLLLNVFPPFQEKKSIIDSNFNPEIENNIKKYAISVIKSGSKQPSQNNFFPSLKKHITLKSAVVRNSFGVVCGAVIALSNLPKSDEKRKDDKKQEQEENN
jgi:signal transduction histidine kinase